MRTRYFTRYFTYEQNARDWADGMVEALRTIGEPADDIIWGIEIMPTSEPEYYAAGTRVRQKNMWKVEWYVDEKAAKKLLEMFENA